MHSRLVLSPELHPYPFAGRNFNVGVYLQAVDNAAIINVVFGDTRRTVVDARGHKVFGDGEPKIDVTGKCELVVAIGSLSMHFSNRPFLLHVAPRDARDAATVDAVSSRPLLVVNHRLEITNKLDGLWYKDEGGRDKCLALSVRLVGPDAQPVHRRVGLRVKLLYESEAEVTRQDVLRVADSVPALQNGSVCVHVRIEDVSKNHQNQRFRIAVLPDAVKAPADGDISPAVSNPVLVRSKRNKRNRKFAHLRSLGSQPTAPAPAPAIDTPRDPVTVYTIPPTAPADQLRGWCGRAIHFLRSIESQTIGYEVNGDGVQQVGRPIHRCPSCWAHSSGPTRGSPMPHTADCVLASLLKEMPAGDGASSPALLPHNAVQRRSAGATSESAAVASAAAAAAAAMAASATGPSTRHHDAGGPASSLEEQAASIPSLQRDASLAHAAQSLARNSSLGETLVAPFGRERSIVPLFRGNSMLLPSGAPELGHETSLTLQAEVADTGTVPDAAAGAPHKSVPSAEGEVQAILLALVSNSTEPGSRVAGFDAAGQLMGFFEVSEETSDLHWVGMPPSMDVQSAKALEAALRRYRGDETRVVARTTGQSVASLKEAASQSLWFQMASQVPQGGEGEGVPPAKKSRRGGAQRG